MKQIYQTIQNRKISSDRMDFLKTRKVEDPLSKVNRRQKIQREGKNIGVDANSQRPGGRHPRLLNQLSNR